MSDRIRSVLLPVAGVLFVMTLMVAWGCQPAASGGGGDAEEDLCAGVTCEQGEECDPETGECVPAGGEGEGEGEGVLAQAATRARELDAGAVVIQASGLNGAILDGTGSQTLEWEFVAVNPDAPETTWVLSYDGEAWSDEQIDSVLVGVVYEDVTLVEMTEEQARERLAAADLEDDFFGWALYQPLHPGSLNPLYAFNYGTSTATVDTATGQVNSATVPQEEPPLMVPPSDDSVSLQYLHQAAEEIRTVDEAAMVIWAGGRDGDDQPLEAPGDTNVWDFKAVAMHDDEVRSWTLTYTGEWAVTEDPLPPFGIEFLDLTVVGMDVVEAWSIAVDAGYQPPAQWWILFKSLNPTSDNPLYVFPTATGYLLVDTVTGEVTFE